MDGLKDAALVAAVCLILIGACDVLVKLCWSLFRF